MAELLYVELPPAVTWNRSIPVQRQRSIAADLCHIGFPGQGVVCPVRWDSETHLRNERNGHRCDKQPLSIHLNKCALRALLALTWPAFEVPEGALGVGLYSE